MIGDTCCLSSLRWCYFCREHEEDSWYKLRFLRAQHDLPWLCTGDFNELLAAGDHIGGNDREEWMMAGSGRW